MSLKSSRNWSVLVGGLILALAVTVPSLQAGVSSAQSSLQAKVQTLVKMSPQARHAALKAMTKQERRSLWFELKRELRASKELKPVTRGSGAYDAPHRIMRAKGAPEHLKVAPKAAGSLGTIKYDDGSGNTTFGGGAIIGNRFNTAVGNPVATSGTISTVVGVVAPGKSQSQSSAGFVIEGPQTASGGAFAIFSTFTGGLTQTTTVTYAGLGVNYTGSSFMVLFGDFASSYDPVFDTGTTQGQGHHGIVGYTGGQGPNITGTFDFGGTLNALVRVTGNVLPVELMSFDVSPGKK